MNIGENIRKYRKKKGYTQEGLAEILDVSFQAVSSWERDEYKPDVDRLIALAEALDVSVSDLTEAKPYVLSDEKSIFNWEHMKSFVKTTAKNRNMVNTLKALDYATQAHKGQFRKRSTVPYIYHPLNLACHCLAMNINEDEIIAACLLHDVIEDCGKTVEELPVNEETKRLVILMSHEKDDSRRNEILKQYYRKLSEDPKAALIKCVDRCNNLTTMSWGLSRERKFRMIEETEKYILPLLKTVRSRPEYDNAAWLLQYQIASMLDIYKRTL